MSTFKLGDKNLNLVAIPEANLKEVTTAGANDAASCLKQQPESDLVIKNVNCKKEKFTLGRKHKTVYCKSKETEVYVCPEGYTLRSSDKKCVYSNDKIDYVCPSNTTFCPNGITGLNNNNVCEKPKTIQNCECK